MITTVPNVSFIAYTTKGEKIDVHNPATLPDPSRTERIEEPYIKAQIITQAEYIGNIMTLCINKRGMLISPVSYTHLDVYKRQRLRRL